MKTTIALGIEDQCDRVNLISEMIKLCHLGQIANDYINYNCQAGRFNYTPRGEIQLPKVKERAHLVLSERCDFPRAAPWQPSGLSAGRKRRGRLREGW